MQNSKDNRCYPRVTFQVEAEIYADGAPPVYGPARDISVHGIYVRCPNPLPKGARCRVIVYGHGPASWLHVNVAGLVTRSEDAGMSIQFQNIGFDAYTLLHGLVANPPSDPELNLPPAKSA